MAQQPCARACLGGDAASVEADAQRINGVLRQSGAEIPAAAMLISVDNGLSVQEYLDSTGRVFAVSWNGPALPDLKVLLGDYFTSYTATLARLPNPGRQRALQVTSANLVVRTAGHLRAYRGLAYLQDRVPAGVAIRDLR